MNCDKCFRLVDDYLAHLDQVLESTQDDFLRSRYTGMLAVGAVTVYELAIKAILTEYAERKHPVFGLFVDRHFKRLNGRISLKDLREDHLKRFGNEYVKRFEDELSKKEKYRLEKYGESVQSSYGNIITWRNEFAHQGRVPVNATYEEVKKSYEFGKEIIRCLAEAMNNDT